MANRVLVLGSGPEAMIAGRAVIDAGARVAFVSARIELQTEDVTRHSLRAIPNTHNVKMAVLRHEVKGTSDAYRAKIYGADWDGQGQVLPSDHMIFDLEFVYQELWALFGGYVDRGVITPANVDSFLAMCGADFVVSTIPAKYLCTQGHTFKSYSIKFAEGEIPYGIPENMVRWNGTQDVSWYKISNIFGHKRIEWPSRVSPPIPGTRESEMPIDNNCSCHPEILRVGTRGAWKERYPINTVYYDVYEAVERLVNG